jgi:succinyl-diaminopimelate desuccinylase
VSATLELTEALMRRPSVTPDDAGCQQLIAARLEQLGFNVTHLRFGSVDNLWARFGDAKPLVVFAGHTDVVPPGPTEEWASSPFEPTIRDGYLYGRGAADMKGSLAAMITAVEKWLPGNPQPQGSVGFLITSDEEGVAVDGTVRVVDYLSEHEINIDHCIVGEPSSKTQLGDMVRNGRRGSVNGHIVVRGIQGHVAYPDDAKNPLHDALPVFSEIAAIQWDEGSEYFPPTSLQFANLNAGTGATNVIPGALQAHLNIRFNTLHTPQSLDKRIRDIFTAAGLDYQLDWELSGLPFITPAGDLTRAVSAAIAETLGVTTTLSTAGGTSDGRFIAPTGAGVVELGPVNASIHKVNERVAVDDLERLSDTFAAVLTKLLPGPLS